MKYVSVIQNGRIETSGMSGKTFTYENDSELVGIIESLIDSDVAFVDQQAGWPPAAILQDLINKKLLTKSFKAITWSGPNNYRVYEVS